MTLASALAKVKLKYNIPTSTTSWDSVINGCIADAVELLSGYVYKTNTATQAITFTDTEFTVTAGRIVRQLWFDDGSGKKSEVNDWYQRSNKVYLMTTLDGTITYEYDENIGANDTDLGNLSSEFNQPLLNFCYSEFASFLAGDDANYSKYMQSAGARAVDNMVDLANFYENKAQRQLDKVERSDGVG